MAGVGGPRCATTAVVQATKLSVPSKPNTKKAATTTAASTVAVAATDVDKPGLRATTRTGKKAPIFWDSDGVNGGKTSLRVILDWMSDQANYDKWRGSDRNSGKTKEALLGEILEQLEKAHIKHRDRARRSATSRNPILQRNEKQPLAVKSSSTCKKQKPDSDERLLEQQEEAFRARKEKRERAMVYQEREHELRRKELQLKEEKHDREKAHADLELKLKLVHLKTAEREAAVQLLLARKKLQDGGVAQKGIAHLLPISSVE
ncbi:hypothetical protein PHMEG_00032362 [Phytophthora megakarya]|uniref:Uncharacterized protein n=1 Tax=Phytophthora megakarya TaxID=4795 RepID=A0A225UW39_9STRA|nr:hypothetical protein PHMEG_00032362 [Phytophthora megakarya]